MKKIIRLTESELKSIIRNSVDKIIREDVLGDDWRENEENLNVMNNYEPFEAQEELMDNEHDWSVKGEDGRGLDPTHYDNYSDDIVNGADY